MYISGVLVANKIDLDQRRIIGMKEGEKLAESLGLKYFECSAVSVAPKYYLSSQHEVHVGPIKILLSSLMISNLNDFLL